MGTRMQLEDWLDDLCVRFIINLPQEELESVERICFQVEEAQWFYEDFIRPLNPSLPSMSLRSFCLRIFQHCPLLSEFSTYHHSTAFSEFLAYKTRVPVRGAIMLNDAMDEVVLVKGWKKGANWSFPRGKINKDEKDLDCAVREVYEETGLDLRAAGLVREESQMKYIEVTMREQHMRLYVFRGVPIDTHFEPRTRKEISKIQWYKLSELPTIKKMRQHQQGRGEDLAINANKFYMVAPFLVPLKKWIRDQNKHNVAHGSATAPAEPDRLDGLPSASMNIISPADRAPNDTNINLSDSPQAHKAETSATTRPTEDPSAQLKRLLCVEEASLHPTNVSPVKSNSGNLKLPDSKALLALLRNGNDNSSLHQTSRTMPLQTPIDQVMATPQMPEPPHHQHPRPLHTPRLPPPPSFPFPNVDPQDLPIHPSQLPPSTHTSAHASITRPDSSGRISNPPSHLEFRRTSPSRFPFSTGPQTNDPALQPSSYTNIQIPRPYQRTGDPNFVQAPQSALLHVPVIPPASKLPPPKLTSHSLALLNVFKNGKLAVSQNAPGLINGESSPGQLSAEAANHEKPRSLNNASATDNSESEETWRNSLKANLYHTVQANRSFNAAPSGSLVPGESASRNKHQDALLELFRKPSTTIHNTTPTKTSLTTAAPVELSAQPSPAPKTQHLMPDTNASASSTYKTTVKSAPSTSASQRFATISGPLSLPQFNAAVVSKGNSERDGIRAEAAGIEAKNRAYPTSILARSASAQAPQIVEAQAKHRGQVPPKARQQPSAPVSKPFEPRILRRPAQIVPQSKASSAPLGSSQPPLDRVEHPTEHKKSLLSLLRAPSAMDNVSQTPLEAAVSPFTEKPPGLQTNDSITSRSRIGSVTSLKGDAQGRKLPSSGSRTPQTPVDKGFLLGYLEGVVKNELR